ncbi:hypothetical protein [Nocardia xishanensis]
MKEAAARGGWRTVDLPGSLAGRVAGVSADDDEVMAIDRDGRFFTMDWGRPSTSDRTTACRRWMGGRSQS